LQIETSSLELLFGELKHEAGGEALSVMPDSGPFVNPANHKHPSRATAILLAVPIFGRALGGSSGNLGLSDSFGPNLSRTMVAVY
jgi:hypothetical protein